MHRITVKLFAHLGEFMPAGSTRGEALYDCREDSTVSSVLDALQVPRRHCHLVLVNGLFIHPDRRDRYRLADGDVLAVWPPIAGG